MKKNLHNVEGGCQQMGQPEPCDIPIPQKISSFLLFTDKLEILTLSHLSHAIENQFTGIENENTCDSKLNVFVKSKYDIYEFFPFRVEHVTKFTFLLLPRGSWVNPQKKQIFKGILQIQHIRQILHIRKIQTKIRTSLFLSF